jgi:O-antigen ligase
VLAVCLVAGALSMPYVVEPMKAWFLAHMDMTTWWSAHHRLYIWSFVLDRMAERPFLGWGLEASRVMPDFGWIPWPGQDRMIPLHPHNEFLQVWMELGPLGLGLLLAGLLVPLRNALACAPGQRIFIAGAWTTTVVAMLPGYGAGQAWWLFTVLGLGVLFRAVLIAEDKT